MSKKVTFSYYCDPGHGWVKVERKRLNELGLLDKISNYSYQRNDNVYLEEDSDLDIFLKAMRQAGYSVQFKQQHTNRRSKIRNYSGFYNG